MSTPTRTRKNSNPVIPDRERMIAEAAYYHAEQRGFEGDEADRLQDWLTAEREVDSLLQKTPALK